MATKQQKYTAGGGVLGYLLGGLDAALLGGIGGYLYADHKYGSSRSGTASLDPAYDWDDANNALENNQRTATV